MSEFKGADVPQRRIGDPRQGLAGEEALVRRDEHVRERQQPGEYVVLEYLVRQILEEHACFLFVHVQSGGTDVTALQGGDQSPAIEQRAPPRVDQEHPALHPRDRVRVDEVVRSRRQRHVKGDDVRPAV